MGIATEHAPAPYGGMSAYSLWEIDVKLFDGLMQQIDAFTSRQDLWITPDQFVVRLTRSGDNNYPPYEDRGAVKGGARIAGPSGFGGTLAGALLKNNGVFLDGVGGSADTILVATQTGPDHFRCFRRFEVREPISLWGTEVEPGTYYATTEDQLLSQADEPPPLPYKCTPTAGRDRSWSFPSSSSLLCATGAHERAAVLVETFRIGGIARGASRRKLAEGRAGPRPPS